MMSLLQLPREIRDHIFDILLCGSKEFLPTVLYAKKWNTRRDLEDPTATKIFHSSLPPTANVFHSLSLTNRQLHTEVRHLLQRNQRSAHSEAHLELDLLLEDLTTYYATWLRVLPYHNPVIKVVRLQIRTFFAVRDGRDLLPQDMSAASMDPNAASYAVAWRLGAVINNLLCHGPACTGTAWRTSIAKPFIIQDLVVEIVRPHQMLKSIDGNDTELIRIATRQANCLEHFMVRSLGEMFSARTGKYQVPWGPLVLSRVRKVIISSKGTVLKTFAIATLADALGVPILRLENEGTPKR